MIERTLAKAFAPRVPVSAFSIVRSRFNDGVLYTVATGRILMITSAWVQAQQTAASTNLVTFTFQPLYTTVFQSLVSLTIATTGIYSQAITCCVPVGAQAISCLSTDPANVTYAIGFVGWETSV